MDLHINKSVLGDDSEPLSQEVQAFTLQQPSQEDADEAQAAAAATTPQQHSQQQLQFWPYHQWA
jgi:hypothetical protein